MTNECKTFYVNGQIFLSDNDNRSIGERLSEWINEKYGGWGSQKRCGEALEINLAQLSSYVKGKRVPDAATLSKFAGAGLNINWLLTGEGEPISKPDILRPMSEHPTANLREHPMQREVLLKEIEDLLSRYDVQRIEDEG